MTKKIAYYAFAALISLAVLLIQNKEFLGKTISGCILLLIGLLLIAFSKFITEQNRKFSDPKKFMVIDYAVTMIFMILVGCSFLIYGMTFIGFF